MVAVRHLEYIVENIGLQFYS